MSGERGAVGANPAGGVRWISLLVLLDAAARLDCAGFVVNPRRQDFAKPGLVRAARGLLSEAAETVGCRSLDRAIALADPGRESPIESLSAGHFELAGLPRPLFQEPVRTPFGVYFPDCLWPEYRLIGESDGAGKYKSREVIIAEKEREQKLRDQDWGFVRWLGKEIMGRPQLVVDRVLHALAERSSRL